MWINDGVLVSTPKNTRDMERAQAAFHKKEAQAREGASATAEYKAAANAERAKTERLKALRLAKEAAEREAAANAPPPCAEASRETEGRGEKEEVKARGRGFTASSGFNRVIVRPKSFETFPISVRRFFQAL